MAQLAKLAPLPVSEQQRQLRMETNRFEEAAHESLVSRLNHLLTSNSYWISIKIETDKDAFTKWLKAADVNGQQLVLPGVTVPAPKVSEDRSISDFVTSVVVEVGLKEKITDPLKEQVTNMVTERFESMGVNKSFVQNTFNLDHLPSGELETPIKGIDSWRDILQVIGTVFLALLFAFLGVLIVRSAKRIAEALKGIGSAVDRAGAAAPSQANASVDTQDPGKTTSYEHQEPTGSAQSWLELMETIKQRLNRDQESFATVATYLGSMQRFDLLYLQFLCLGKSETQSPEAILAKEHQESFSSYKLLEANTLLASPAKRLSALKELLEIVSMAQLDEVALMQRGIRISLEQATDDRLVSLINTCDEEDIPTIIRNCSVHRIAHLLTKGLIQPKQLLDGNGEVNSTPSLVRIMNAFAEEISNKSTQKDHMLEIGTHLPAGQDSKFFQDYGQGNDLSLEFLSSGRNELITNWVNSLEMNDSSLVMATFGDELKNSVLDSLPEIKSNRLRVRGFEITPRSLQLKASLIEHLVKSVAQDQKQNLDTTENIDEDDTENVA
jgi:hypothetical protein